MKKNVVLIIMILSISLCLTACQGGNVPVDNTTGAVQETEAPSEGTQAVAEEALTQEETTEVSESEAATETVIEEQTAESSATEEPEESKESVAEETEKQAETEPDRSNIVSEGAVPQHTADTMTARNEVVQRFDTGQTVLVDLDGDGTDEKLMVVMEESITHGWGEKFYHYYQAILINEHYYTKEAFREMYAENPYKDYFYLMDLDTTDQWIEIALLASGPSADPQTHFYRYHDGNLICIGSVPNTLWVGEDGTMSSTILGDGKYTGWARVYIIETASATLTWKLNNATEFNASIESDNGEYIEFVIRKEFGKEYWKEIIKEFPVYKEKAEDPAGIIYLPVGTKLEFVRYYSEGEWLEFVYGDEEKTGWIRAVDHEKGTTILPADIERWDELYDYISGLSNAG